MLTDKQLIKFRRPIHISYVKNNILKLNEEQTKEIIDKLVDDGIIEESVYGKGYFVLKNNNINDKNIQ